MSTPKKNATSASSAETATNPSKPTDHPLAKACFLLAEAGHTLAHILEATGEGSRNDVAVARLGTKNDDDVVMICHLTLVSKRGVIAEIASENTLPAALEPHMLSASVGNFSNMLEAVITNPLTSSFQAYIAKQARENKGRADLMDHLGDFGAVDTDTLHDD